MKLQLDQPVLTPSGKTGRVVATGLPDGTVRVRLDPFLPDWAGSGKGQKTSRKRSRWWRHDTPPPPRKLIGVEVVYRTKDLTEGKR